MVVMELVHLFRNNLQSMRLSKSNKVVMDAMDRVTHRNKIQIQHKRDAEDVMARVLPSRKILIQLNKLKQVVADVMAPALHWKKRIPAVEEVATVLARLLNQANRIATDRVMDLAIFLIKILRS